MLIAGVATIVFFFAFGFSFFVSCYNWLQFPLSVGRENVDGKNNAHRLAVQCEKYRIAVYRTERDKEREKRVYAGRVRVLYIRDEARSESFFFFSNAILSVISVE